LTGIKIDGKQIAQSIKDDTKKDVLKLKEQNVLPCLATILVGDDSASATYVKNKHKACQEVGILTRDHKLASSTTLEQLCDLIDSLNSDHTVHGILVQLPLPEHLDEFIITSRISPSKDVDGLTPYNVGLLSIANKKKQNSTNILVACTPSGIMKMFDYHNIDLTGKDIVVINRSNLIGKPLYHLLLARDATVITCHSKTKNLAEYCKRADVIITAVGNRDNFELTTDMIKEDAIIIDVAITRYNQKLAGDADYEKIIQKASFATPVPGGVGPMTVAMLLKNTVLAASSSHNT
jgi:methylenetetrahydrofolate dehydrogenase (NADP+)/methenyltetrahydrofolate cyclohydrolase